MTTKAQAWAAEIAAYRARIAAVKADKPQVLQDGEIWLDQVCGRITTEDDGRVGVWFSFGNHGVGLTDAEALRLAAWLRDFFDDPAQRVCVCGARVGVAYCVQCGRAQ